MRYLRKQNLLKRIVGKNNRGVIATIISRMLTIFRNFPFLFLSCQVLVAVHGVGCPVLQGGFFTTGPPHKSHFENINEYIPFRMFQTGNNSVQKSNNICLQCKIRFQLKNKAYLKAISVTTKAKIPNTSLTIVIKGCIYFLKIFFW